MTLPGDDYMRGKGLVKVDRKWLDENGHGRKGTWFMTSERASADVVTAA